MTVDAVIFDWGGTLTDPVLAVLELVDLWRVAAEHLAPGDEVRQERLTTALIDAEARSWQRITETQQSATLAQVMAEGSRALGLDVAEAVMEEAALRHLDAWTPHIHHDPDAVNVLEALKARGLRIGLLSNTHWPRSFHEHFLERDGLAGYIDARLYSSELSHTKPHPSAFERALEAVGVDTPGRAVFVGDRLYDDIFGASRVGLRTVHRPSGTVPAYDVVPDAVITALPDLLEVIDTWS